MEFQFNKERISCLEPILREVQNWEESQELKLTDGMPDAGRVLGGWGQVILRGKEWRSQEVWLSGGVQVRVVYLPEDGTQPRCLEGWIPFQMKWLLPDNAPEGTVRFSCLLRFVDARSVSARRIMVRCGVAVQMQALCLVQREISIPQDIPQEVALRRCTHEVHLGLEAGEKTFTVDEELPLPGSAPQPEKLLACRLSTRITDPKVLGDKVVFRGTGELHLVYLSREGRLVSWDLSIPISQYAQLRTTHDGESQADIRCCVTDLETSLDDSGTVRCRCGLTGQYLILGRREVELTEDAYAPGRDLELSCEMLELPSMGPAVRETVALDQQLAVDADTVVDVQVLPDFPQYRGADREGMLTGGTQVIYYGPDGSLQSAASRWELPLSWPEDCRTGIPCCPGMLQIFPANGMLNLRGEIPVDLEGSGVTAFPMVTGFDLGDAGQPDPNRPSLILCRARSSDLWELAKETSSTEARIRAANGLEGDPEPERMLLIPVL